jgi:hypothetical protein
VAVGQSQPLYSGVGIFNWYYLSSTPRELRAWQAELEWMSLIYVSPPLSRLTPGVFYSYFYNYNHARRLLRLEKLLLYTALMAMGAVWMWVLVLARLEGRRKAPEWHSVGT